MKGEKVKTDLVVQVTQINDFHSWDFSGKDEGYIQAEVRERYGENTIDLTVGDGGYFNTRIVVSTSSLIQALVKAGFTADALRNMAHEAGGI